MCDSDEAGTEEEKGRPRVDAEEEDDDSEKKECEFGVENVLALSEDAVATSNMGANPTSARRGAVTADTSE